MLPCNNLLMKPYTSQALSKDAIGLRQSRLSSMHVENWHTYVCKVRHCKPIVTNHINVLTDNEHGNTFYYRNHYNVYFNISVTS